MHLYTYFKYLTTLGNIRFLFVPFRLMVKSADHLRNFTKINKSYKLTNPCCCYIYHRQQLMASTVLVLWRKQWSTRIIFTVGFLRAFLAS